VGRSPCRDDGSVVYNCCWSSPAQPFSDPGPVGLVTIFYCLRLETSLFIASYDAHGCGGCIRPRLHMGWCSVGQFSPWGRFWSNRTEITSFNSIVLAFLAVTLFWPVRCRVNSLYLSVVTETFLYALLMNRRLSMQCIASSVAFVGVETWLPSRCVAMGAWLCRHYCGFLASCHNIIGKLPAYDVTHW
jgi:hypothetical protein